jgi:hypothetical protein
MPKAKLAGTRLRDALPENATRIGSVGNYDKYQHGPWLYLVDRKTGEVINVAQDRR